MQELPDNWAKISFPRMAMLRGGSLISEEVRKGVTEYSTGNFITYYVIN
jgi:hypothetical protein